MGWWDNALKNWRDLGPWFHRRLRVLVTSSGVYWTGLFFRAEVRVCGSVVRTRLARVVSGRGGGGGGVAAEVVVRWCMNG